MKKRLWFLLVLTLMLTLFLAGTAGAQDYVSVGLAVACGAGETIQPEYPDLSSRIGPGLTQDDFIVTYECPSPGTYLTVDRTTGSLSVTKDGWYPNSYQLFVTYTPKVEGVGTKAVFSVNVFIGTALKYLKLDRTELVLGLDQTGGTTVRYNSSQIATFPKCKVLDPEIVDARIDHGNRTCSYTSLHITPKAVGETIVTVYGYNGLSVDISVKVMEPPTELTFAQEVYECFEGEEISLNVKLGDGEHAPNFRLAQVNGNAAGKYFKGGITGVFCSENWGEFRVRAETYNGFSGSAIIRVYEKEPASDIKLSADIVRAGEKNIKVLTYDAEGNYVRARYISITKGMDIASMDDNTLITTAPGEIEVTVTNLDGTTVSKAFTIEPYPTEIILNASELTMNIDDTFDVEVGFDQGSLPYEIYVSGSEGHNYQLPAIRIEDQRVIAQNSGTSMVIVQAGELVSRIVITVPASDKTPVLVWPEEDPFPINGTFQFAVKDMAGNVLPAKFNLRVNDQAGTITEDGFFKALKSGSVSIYATLADGRKLTKSLKIVPKPNWMRVESQVITVGTSEFLTVQTDVGELSAWEYEVSVKDESIAKWDYPALRALKVGRTEVTVTCLHNGASITFSVDVRPENDKVFVGATSFEMPCDFSATLPAVYDEKGKEKKVKWVITHDNPGEGNPNKSGFKLDGNEITCTWPTATCEVTGYMDGASKWVRVSVFAYKIPDAIRIEPEIIEMDVGDAVTVEVFHDELGAKFPAVYWLAEPEGILSFKDMRQSAKNTITAQAPGNAILMALLDNGAYAVCLVTVADPNARVPGDANADDVVDMMDAVRILQYDVGWNVEINLDNADVDADGAVTMADAVLILQYDVGWNVTLK